MSLRSRRPATFVVVRLYTVPGARLECEGDEEATPRPLYYLPSFDKRRDAFVLHGYDRVDAVTGLVGEPRNEIPVPDLDSLTQEKEILLVVCFQMTGSIECESPYNPPPPSYRTRPTAHFGSRPTRRTSPRRPFTPGARR